MVSLGRNAVGLVMRRRAGDVRARSRKLVEGFEGDVSPLPSTVRKSGGSTATIPEGAQTSPHSVSGAKIPSNSGHSCRGKTYVHRLASLPQLGFDCDTCC